MSSSSSSPRETYEEDREYESQAKRLKTEEGEIDYSAEEGENRREATPRGGGESGGGRSFAQPVTKRGGRSAAAPGSRGGGGTRRGDSVRASRAPADAAGMRRASSSGLPLVPLPASRIPAPPRVRRGP